MRSGSARELPRVGDVGVGDGPELIGADRNPFPSNERFMVSTCCSWYNPPNRKEKVMQVSDEMLSDATQKGRAIYSDKLQAILEPDHDGEFVVIHVDSGDYQLGKTLTKALDTMLERHEPDGRLFGMKVGPEPEYGLAARIQASRMSSTSRK
jgi:hypothetical protein